MAAALIGLAAAGAPVPARATSGPVGRPAPLDDPDPSLPTNPYDPRCAAMPEWEQCRGGRCVPPAPIELPR
ncbi:hypothetical protein A5680_15345 [Mycobacterium sp. E2989]|nr:hypothetical protein A5680_15345 [Mycobacterium sp. E2989]